MVKSRLLAENDVMALLRNLSNPVRKSIVEVLGQRGGATFSDLLVLCALNTYYQKGLLDYHLKELQKSGILCKAESGYLLTGIGDTVARFLESVEKAYERLFISETKGGEMVQVRIEPLEDEDACEVCLAKYGTGVEMENEALWACGKKVPLKHMSGWGKTVSLLARSDDKIIGVFHGNTIPMHIVNREGEKLGVIQPRSDRPANRVDGEIFEIWIHRNYEGCGVEKQLIEAFIDHMKEQGALTIIAERVLTENEDLRKAFEDLNFQQTASYQDYQKRI